MNVVSLINRHTNGSRPRTVASLPPSTSIVAFLSGHSDCVGTEFVAGESLSSTGTARPRTLWSSTADGWVDRSWMGFSAGSFFLLGHAGKAYQLSQEIRRVSAAGRGPRSRDRRAVSARSHPCSFRRSDRSELVERAAEPEVEKRPSVYSWSRE